MTSSRSTCLYRVLEILASTVLCQLSYWFSRCVLIYLIVVFVLLNTHKSCVCVLASPIMLAPSGCSNMFSVTHYNRTLIWFHPVHSLNRFFIRRVLILYYHLYVHTISSLLCSICNRHFIKIIVHR